MSDNDRATPEPVLELLPEQRTGARAETLDDLLPAIRRLAGDGGEASSPREHGDDGLGARGFDVMADELLARARHLAQRSGARPAPRAATADFDELDEVLELARDLLADDRKSRSPRSERPSIETSEPAPTAQPSGLMSAVRQAREGYEQAGPAAAPALNCDDAGDDGHHADSVVADAAARQAFDAEALAPEIANGAPAPAPSSGDRPADVDAAQPAPGGDEARPLAAEDDRPKVANGAAPTETAASDDGVAEDGGASIEAPTGDDERSVDPRTGLYADAPYVDDDPRNRPSAAQKAKLDHVAELVRARAAARGAAGDSRPQREPDPEVAKRVGEYQPEDGPREGVLRARAALVSGDEPGRAAPAAEAKSVERADDAGGEGLELDEAKLREALDFVVKLMGTESSDGAPTLDAEAVERLRPHLATLLKDRLPEALQAVLDQDDEPRRASS